MTVLPRNLLIGSFLMVAALVAASCSSSETGQTLSVTAVPNSPQQVQTGEDVKANPIINYKGRKELLINWSMVKPAGGDGDIVSGGDSKSAVFNFVKPGTYKVVLNVQEDGGNISETDSGIYTVVAGPLTAGGPDVSVAITNNALGTAQNGQGIATVTITGGVAPYTVNWNTGTTITFGNVASFTSTPSSGSTSTNSASKTFFFTTSPGTSIAPGTFTITGTVTDSSGADPASFQINIAVVFTAAS